MQINKIKNPFSRLNDTDWKKYSTELHPHFTEEPYYEIVPWSTIKARIEDNAKEAGFFLVLRTTNNKCYCPDNESNEWVQRTQWLFAYPNKRIIIHIVYAEQGKKIEEKDNWLNYISIDVHMELPLHEVDVTDEYKQWFEDFDASSYRFSKGETISRNGRLYAYVYRQPCPPDGYVSNGGMVKPGITEYHYFMIEGKKTRFHEDLQEKYKHPGYTNVLERDITPSFFKEWIEKNPYITAGKIEDIHMWGYSDTYIFPGRSQSIPLTLYMDFLFLEKLRKSSITDFVTHPFDLSQNFCLRNGIEGESISILQGKLNNEWFPVFNHESKNPLEKFEELRINPLLQMLIDKDLSSITMY